MSSETQLIYWLKRPEKTFCESLQFALKVWKSSDFSLPSKYEIILNWIAEEGKKSLVKEGVQLPKDEMEEVFQLRAQPALISLETKRKFVKMLIKSSQASTSTDRLYPQLLSKLIGLEWMQDLLRGDYLITALIYSTMLQCYEKYLIANQQTSQLQLIGHESDFFLSMMNLLKEHLKSTSNLADWAKVYYSHIVQPLTNVFLLLRSKYNIDFFEEFRELEQTLLADQKEFNMTILELPTHSALLIIECNIANRRMKHDFLSQVVVGIFPKYSDNQENKFNTKSFLKKAAYTLDVFRKYNVTLNFQIEQSGILTYLGERVYEYVKYFKDSYLSEILLLLCATVRLNPLILEQHVFEVTGWMILAAKPSTSKDQIYVLFEEYLALLLDTFRRLSRAEKFVSNLLKGLKQALAVCQLQPPSKSSSKKSRKRGADEVPSRPSKQLKINEEEGIEIASSNSDDYYMEMAFEAFYKQMLALKYPECPSALENSFNSLNSYWPSTTIGCSFSRLISGLVTKASLTIWKTLLFGLKDQISTETHNYESNMESAENVNFRIDFHTALLCQYLSGAKFTEQYGIYATEIDNLRKFTMETISLFGKFVLSSPYGDRAINAFLEASYHASNFELLLSYYKPDGFNNESLMGNTLVKNMHGFLSEQEWSILKERIVANGDSDCRVLFERLLLQRLEAKNLLSTTLDKKHLDRNSLKILICNKNTAELINFLSNTPHAVWLMSQLNHLEKNQIAQKLAQAISSLENTKLVEYIGCSAEMLELYAYSAFEQLKAEFLQSSCKSSMFATIDCDYAEVRECNPDDHQEFDTFIKLAVKTITNHNVTYKIKNLPSENIKIFLAVLHRLPLGHLRRQTKSLLFTFFVTLYRDLKMAQQDQLANELFDCLTDFLHFGHQVPIFRYFELSKILELLPIADCWELYEFMFSNIKSEEKGTEEFLETLVQLLQDSFNSNGSFSVDERRLLLLAIETLSTFTGPIVRRLSKHLRPLLSIYGDYVYAHFENETNEKKNKKFVEKTLVGLAPFLKHVLGSANKKTGENENQENQKPLKPLDENLRRISKIYMGYSMDFRNRNAIDLLKVCLNNRKLLHLDQDEIELLLNNYWRQLSAHIQQKVTDESGDGPEQQDNTKSAEDLMKIIIDNKTNEDLLLSLKDIGMNLNSFVEAMNTLDLLTVMAKSSFSTIKGAIFNDQFKQITASIITRHVKNACLTEPQHQKLVLKLLNLQKVCIENRTIFITPDTFDTILSFLIDINVKKFPITDTNLKDFVILHATMTQACTSLLKQRHLLLMDRVVQFMHIFKDLLQAIIRYKNERLKDTPLNSNEINDLAELALKLEVLMHSVATHSTDFKRIAPFVLVFTINLMVSSKRPTTLYPKIKTHIEAICCSLIGICDHRVGHFILRCSNEAARQTYETLVKEHKKYHKFKGKV